MPNHTDTSFLDHMPQNCAVQFWDRVAASGPREAFRFPVGETWKSVTWAETGDEVRRIAAGLLGLGLQREDRVAIAAATRYEWILADLAIMCAGGATTTVYPTTGGEDTAYIIGDSGSRVVFAEDDVQVAKLRDHRDELPEVMKVVSFDAALADGDWVISMDDLARIGEEYLAEHPEGIEIVAKDIAGDQLATLIYTSGTTGKPKGVRTLHRGWVFEGEAIKAQDILNEDDLQFLWLPMAHSFGKVLLSTQLACGFATAIDGRVDKIVDNLGVVKPTFMGAAPRIFEKAYSRIVTMQAAEGGLKEKIFKRAFAVGAKVDELKLAGKSVPLGLKLQHGLFDKLVFSKVRDRFGGRVKFFISGSAALNADIARWFHAAGVLILEGYGMTENSAGATVNHPDRYKMGTVGLPFPGTEVRIGDNGEVQLKGPHIMAGYHNRPEATAEALTADGWLRTGDRGQIDEDGYLTITGRIKELFKTSGGKYIAPPAIEAKFKAICPYVSQFMVFGAERNFVSALITLDPDGIAGWAEENGKGGTSYTDLVRDPQVVAMVGEYVDQLNAQLNRWETVKKWTLLDHDLSIESGELTPSMKVKRNVVEANNKDVIDSFYVDA
ncbi:long-chain fatty acid--CoA ligase [Nocardioides sp. zg-536]|uniref:Acyl-CoA synthetase n=1 Tax=Nocardioides faecalis TaxID=2803858 RepID=A0A939BW82_9ACTN|nr:AMP-dependent synthetase/ligase [Nocardioides faecalis]MBM9460317.1 long-chain fatty acid--CoA ligase [Nocardioides faecalis]MBS4751242.1 long-chain fatty acid--CoA ligase [Nocardioides faecalis]QVI59851.1 long-chain fatty acid--CoA ligase [Nocardioides faecalis]